MKRIKFKLRFYYVIKSITFGICLELILFNVFKTHRANGITYILAIFYTIELTNGLLGIIDTFKKKKKEEDIDD